MAKNSLNAYAPSSFYAVWTAPLGTALPTSPVQNPGAGWYEVGAISDDGITETRDVNENIIYDLIGNIVRTIRNQEQRSFGFTALEDNRVVRELKYVGSTFSSTGGTAEVQTVTISGTPTGGTFPLTLPGYGSYTAAYNATAPTVQSGVQAAWGIAVTVSLASNVYTFTFPASAGNVPTIQTNGASLTGGTTPNAVAATTTPGVNGTNTRTVASGTAQNYRTWYIVSADGTKQQAVGIAIGEASATGDTVLSGSDVKKTEFSVKAYPDPANNGALYVVLDNDSAQGVTYA